MGIRGFVVAFLALRWQRGYFRELELLHRQFADNFGDLQQFGSPSPGQQAIRPWMKGGVRAPTSSTANIADGSITASVTPIISAARTRTAEPGGMDRTENMDMETDTSLLQTPTPWTRISEPGEDLSHSFCLQESVTARTSSSVPLVLSPLPSANPSSHPSSSRPLSYAQIKNRTTSPPSSSSAPSSPSPLKMTETRRQQRTQILRRTAYETTTKGILQNAIFDAGLTQDSLTCNPMELLTEHHDDVYDITAMTTDTLEYLLRNKHYAPAAAEN